ncbi:subtilisin-like protein [Ramaria rubella]|nr:subtilisin-like protein [Ramaria rubella]
MYWVSAVAVILAFSLPAVASPLINNSTNTFQIKHSRAQVPNGWEIYGDAPPDHLLNLRIGLQESNIDELIRHLLEVSDPSHHRYGQHLSKGEVDALVAPHPQTVDAVDAWLRTHEIDPSTCQRTTAGDWLHLSVSVSTAERMFNTTYNVYRHTKSGQLAVRTLAWSLPRAVHGHIDVVEPTTMFGRLHGMKVTPHIQPALSLEGSISVFSGDAAIPSSCNNTITPSCLRALYKTANYTPAATKKNKIGIVGYLDQFASNADLQSFFKQFRPDARGNFTIVQVHGGGNNQSDPGGEANLDTQYTEGITWPTPNIYYSTGGSPPFKPDDATPTNSNEPYLDWLNFILNQTDIPQTFTTSYGDDEQTVPPDYAVRVCNGFAQLGARGSSIMFSSGDGGVGDGDCKANDGSNATRFQPVFPASCPFVTTVGGTFGINPEQAVSFSGGGFSDIFSRPSYQTTTVERFLKSVGSTNEGLFNVSGRGYPDVAAQAEGFQVVIGGQVDSIGGTSAASPTFAGVIALLNDFRLSRDEPPLGFLNPLIYATPKGFNDITNGSNPACGTNGFTARAGWDPVTGLGTPDFEKLKTLLRK